MAVQQERVLVEICRPSQKQRLCRLQRRHNIFHVPPLHHESLVRDRGDVGKIRLSLIAADLFFERLAASADDILRHAGLRERLVCAFHLVIGVGELKIEEFLRRANGEFPRFFPVLPVKAKIIRRRREPKLVLVLPSQYPRLPDVGVIGRL